jgi:hypothetical protein
MELVGCYPVHVENVAMGQSLSKLYYQHVEMDSYFQKLILNRKSPETLTHKTFPMKL